MKYTELTNVSQLAELYTKPKVVLFKHSTRCPISGGAADEMETIQVPEDVTVARVLVVENRDVSLQIAEDTGVTHASPQVIIMSEGKAVFNTSHQSITKSVVEEAVGKL